MKDVVKSLSAQTGLDTATVYSIMLSAPVRYKTYHIAKRNGGKRKISQPAREVKVLQRALVDTLLQNLPVHSAAKAYRRGLSIRDNAAAHANSGPIIKMDFKDFFPSIKKSDWVDYCNRTKCLSEAVDIELTALLLFQKQSEYRTLRLAIGAPSSPVLSNILLYEFDTKVVEALKETKIIYTRYADDLTFSAPRTGYLHDIRSILPKVLSSMKSPKLTINAEKTTYVTQKYGRNVTGLIISNDKKVTIGWRRKRELHAAVHHASVGKMTGKKIESLAGMLAFVNSVEPEFIDKLKDKYGIDVMSKIKSASAVKKDR